MSDFNTATTPAQSSGFDLDDIEYRLFGPSEREKAAAYIGEVMAVLPASMIKANFDMEKDDAIPADYAVMIVPISRRNEAKKENELAEVVIGAVPSFEKVISDETGKSFVVNSLFSAMKTKLANSARNAETGSLLPFSLSDFTTRKSRSDDLKAFNELAKPMILLLKSNGLRSVTKPSLRSCLSNAAIAESQYPAVPQEQWQKILQALEKMAAQKGLDPSIFAHWANTRDEMELADEALDEDFLEALE